MNYWPLLGVAVVVAGFALRANPVAIVVAAGFASGFAAGKSLPELLALIGESFVSQRALGMVFLTLPVIGVLEWAGLREQARRWIAGFRGVTLSRLLTGYLALRQLLGMIGLTSVGGHAQTVRPLVAPMAVAAAEQQADIGDDEREKVKAYSAATDNVGLFFGEDIFFAIGSIVLIQQVLAADGYVLAPLELALWAIPSAIVAFAIHGARLWWWDRRRRAG